MVAVAPSSVYVRAEQRAAAYVAARKYRKDILPPLPDDWQGWLDAVFASYVRPPFASYHETFWEWVWNLEAGVPSDPFVAIWPRGFGKSTAAEIACAAVAARGTRNYVLYIMETQDQADTHVQNVASLLESKTFTQHYPHVGSRKVGKYGNSMGWRRNRLRTESGFILDAIGLDTAARGAKVDEDRPDLIIGDDLDGLLDTPLTTNKKIQTLTKSLIPAGADHAAVLIVQNLIHAAGIVAQLADGRAEFLVNRHVSGPHPAISDAIYEQDASGKWWIVSGEPTWAARPIPSLQAEIDRIGLAAFRAEKQHEINAEGGIFPRWWWRFWHYQGQPLPPVEVKGPGGTMVDCLVEPLPPTFDDSLQSWDMSFKKTEAGSYVVGQVWGKTRANRYLIDQYRARVDFPDAVLAVRAMSGKHPRVKTKLVENKANGPAVVATLRGDVPGLVEVEPEGGKESRAHAAAKFVESANVYLPHPMIAPWVTQFIDEHATFPLGESDDQVDAHSQAQIRFGSESNDATSYSYLGDGQTDDDDDEPWRMSR